jgi:cyclohexa-1,5-dienecarbonyl-CoA hydratase
MTDAPLKVWLDRSESLLRLRLTRPKANLVDQEMIAALTHAFNEHHQPGRLRAALIDAEGPHFSFGASVEEHLPDKCVRMLKSLHTLLVTMLE